MTVSDNPLKPDSKAAEAGKYYLRPAWRREWFSILAVGAGLYLTARPAMLPFFAQLQQLVIDLGWQIPLSPYVRLLGMLIAVLYGLAVLWGRFRWRYMIGPGGVESACGLIGRDERRAEYRNITYVRLSQGVLQRIFGVGDLLIGTSATDEPEVVFRGIARPRHWKALVQQRLGKAG